MLLFGFLGGVYLPSKFRREDKKPRISAGTFQDRFNMFEITNHGGDLIDFNVEITWNQNGVNKKRNLEKFYNSSDNPMRDKPHLPGSLKSGETKMATECPEFSDDGEVRIVASGKDLYGNDYKEELLAKNNKL